MNPATATVPAAPPRPADPIQGIATTVVDNIPVHAAAAPAAQMNEDDELDRIMQDVGQEMKKEVKKSAKHGFLHLGHKHKKEAPFSIQTARLPQAAPASPPAPAPVQVLLAAAAPLPAAPAPAAPLPQPAAAARPAPAVAAKPKAPHHVPVFVIFVACLATGFLIAAAIAAYRPQ